MYRHGDLLFERTDAIPAGLNVKPDNVLAYGTATGHSHKLVGGAVFVDEDGNVYVRVSGKGSLVHEEHNIIELPAGDYRVVRQREYDPYDRAIRQVVD